MQAGTCNYSRLLGVKQPVITELSEAPPNLTAQIPLKLNQVASGAETSASQKINGWSFRSSDLNLQLSVCRSDVYVNA